MPFPSGDFVHVVFGGVTAGGESWSVGHWQQVTGLTALPTPAQLNTLAGHIATAAGTLWTTLKAKNSSAMDFRTVTVSFYRAGVLQLSSLAASSPVAGTVSAGNAAFLARCVSMLTNQTGRSYRGRSYLPYTGVATTTGTTVWGSDSALLSAYKTFLLACTSNILADLAATTAGPVILSEATASATPVTGLRMDNRPDSQRGRIFKVLPTIIDTATIP